MIGFNEIMKNIIENVISDDSLKAKLMELECWALRMTYPNGLVLDFGNKIEYTLGKFGKRYKGEWSIYSDYCNWRIWQKDTLLCCSYLLDAENDEIIKKIKLEKLINWVHNENDDFIFTFNNDYVIECFCTTNCYEIFSIVNMDTTYAYSRNKKWVKYDDNEPLGLTESEKKVAIHSEECYNRWEQIIPKIDKKMPCNSCIYYIPVKGDFHFSDYGICSNEKSDYDGKVVYTTSSCTLFSKTLGSA